MPATEIEKLERRYAENPQGLTFAPLAEVHRKNGEVARALELLRAGLELHPNYIPASIVLGRCHWDLGDLPAAEAAFSHVLRLDDENVIALKSLADINERLERPGEAQRWLNRLISVDRSNEEARQQLARIEAAKQRTSSASVVAQEIPAAEEPANAQPVVEAEPEPVAAAKPETPIQKPEPVAQNQAQPESPPAALDLTAAIAEAPTVPPFLPPQETPEPKAPVLEFLDTSEPAGETPQAPSLVSEQTIATPEEPAPVAGLISQEFVPPTDASYRLHPELTHDFVGEEPVDPDELEVETADEVELQSSGASEFRVPNAAEDWMDAVAGPAVRTPEPASPPPAAETVSPRPAAEPVSPPPAAEPVSPPPAAEPARRSYSVGETKGQSVASFFQGLLAARPPGNPSSPGDALEGTRLDFASSTPAIPAAAPQNAAVSFDDFFGAAAGGSSSPPTGGADPSKEDLDQFQTWLQNLKR